MSELISGLDIPKLIKDGVEIQYRMATNKSFSGGRWVDFILDELEEEFTLGDLINAGRWDFRLKPRTITLNGIEVPAPFDPKSGDMVWCLNELSEKGYEARTAYNSDDFTSHIAYWRTEEEIKQVVAALKKIFVINNQ